MANTSKGVNLVSCWPLWGLHFAFHIIIGLLAGIAGLVVIFSMGEVLNGLALVGAGSFALFNGWQGVKELGKCHGAKRDITLKGNNR